MYNAHGLGDFETLDKYRIVTVALYSNGDQTTLIRKGINMLTQKRLKELFNYCPDSGDLTRSKGVRGAKQGVARSVNACGYIVIRIDYKLYLAHRLAWLYVHGKLPCGEIDHINGTRDDNRIINIREVSHTDNMKNASIKSNNKSGVTGVIWSEKKKRWHSFIHISGKKMHLGSFKNKDGAVKARKDAEVKFKFHPNHGKPMQR